MATHNEYAFEGAEALLRSMLGRPLIRDGERPFMDAAPDWLEKNDCPRAPHANDRGAYLVTDELARRFRTECWPSIKRLARP